MIVLLAYLASQYTKFHSAGGCCSLVSGLMRFRHGSNKRAALHFVYISENMRRRPFKWLDKRSGKKAWTVHGCLNGVLGSGQTENGETGQEQNEEHAHYFRRRQGDFSQRIRHGRPKSQFRILLRRLTAIEWKCAKISPRTLATKELATASRQRTVSHFLSHQAIFDQKQYDCLPPPTLRPSVSSVEDKTQLRWSGQNRRRCWTPSQNTTSGMHFNKCQKLWERCIHAEATASRVMVSTRLEVSSWTDGNTSSSSTSPGNYGWLFVFRNLSAGKC
jgi:hypothetical protein